MIFGADDAATSCRNGIFFSFSKQFYRCQRGHRQRSRILFQHNGKISYDASLWSSLESINAIIAQSAVSTDLTLHTAHLIVSVYIFAVAIRLSHRLYLFKREKVLLSFSFGSAYRISHTFHASNRIHS